jgi:UDP-N-acetylmuramate dehydrogenase
VNTLVAPYAVHGDFLAKPSMTKHQDLIAAVDGIQGLVTFDAPLREFTTLRIGGPADVLVVPKNIDDACRLMAQAHQAQVPLCVLGGTNVLIRDGGVRGIVVSLANLNAMAVEGEDKTIVYAGGGLRMPTLLGFVGSQSLAGLEWAAGIPGTVGGAVVMNAGTHLGEMKDCLQAIQLINLEGHVAVYSASVLTFSYRRASVPEGIVAGAWLQLMRSEKMKVESATKSYLQYRKNTQPLTKPNSGSVFKNPSKTSAGKLIEEAGLKGLKIGDAQVSPKHANFIVNLGNARATDTMLLIKKIQQDVFHRTGLMLELEWKIIGEG